jgi:hypothetical protein
VLPDKLATDILTNKEEGGVEGGGDFIFAQADKRAGQRQIRIQHIRPQVLTNTFYQAFGEGPGGGGGGGDMSAWAFLCFYSIYSH